jgi:hypothetical protein
MNLRSPELLRLARNLEHAPLTDVLGTATVVLESAREFLAGVLRSDRLAVELLDATMKPVIRELVSRRLELEQHGAQLARGNA